MNVAIDNDQLDKAKAEELISTIPLIPEVKSIDVELYTDHTGDPSLQLVFHVNRETDLNKTFFDRFTAFVAVVQTRILHSDLNRFPYTRLEREQLETI